MAEFKSSQLPEITVEAFQAFSRSVAKRDYGKAVEQCAQLLYGFEAFGTRASVVGGEERSRSVLTLFASSFTALVADPGFLPSRQGLGTLLALKTVLSRIFASTDFADMSHLYGMLGRIENGQMHLGDDDTDKYLVVTTIELATESTFQILESLEHDKKVLFWLSLLDTHGALDPKVHAFIGKLIAMIPQLRAIPMLSVSEIDMANRVWFNCSYWDYEDKHKVKKFLNEVLRKTAAASGIKEQKYFPPFKGDRKPKLLIPLEFWLVGSAMHRCYGKAVEQLKQRFDVVGLAQPGQINERNESAFNQSIELSPLPLENVKKVLALEPDLIFYPSVGMVPTVTHLAQLRLAPLQCMSLGHPASSFSKTMDYVLVEEDWRPGQHCFSEKIVCLKNGTFKLSSPPSVVDMAGPEFDHEKLNVVVNSMYQKLMPVFLDACVEVAGKSARELHFHFLCGATPINKAMLTSLIQSKLEATIYPMMGYDEYFSILKSCDLQLAPFPFGNTNGFIDAMYARVPTVCLEGEEIFSKTDAIISSRIKLPEFSRANSVATYVESALRLISDDGLRLAFQSAIDESEFEKILFEEDGSQVGDLAETLYWLTLNNREINQSKSKYFSVADRMSATRATD